MSIHLIGNAHIDPVWLWRWQEGFAEIKATFRSALDRMEEYEDFVFTSACASYYQWVEENEPEMFREIRERVAEGRWEIAGGSWIQPDCNIPSGESFARHGLYSQRYFLSRFGRMAKTGYNVDSFGHNAMLPQILRLSGMENYVFTRPGDHEKTLPSNLFLWESPDGSRVLAFRIPYGYNSSLDLEKVGERFQSILGMSRDMGIPFMAFYGVGNHGGGPTRALIGHFKKIMADHPGEDIRFDGVDRYFDTVRSKNMAHPVVRDDLQYHASGCYSALSKVKQDNRRCENRLVSAEKFALLAHHLLSLPYDRSLLQKAWQDVLFNQFHDIMGGCSIKEAYEDAAEAHGEALKIAGDVLNASLQKISWSIDTMGKDSFPVSKEMSGSLWEMENRGAPFVVFNPHAWEVTCPVTVPRLVASVTNWNGDAVPIQEVRASRTNGKSKTDTLFMALVQPLGYSTYRVFTKQEHTPPASMNVLDAGEDFLENNWIRLGFDKNTSWMKSLVLKEENREMLLGPGGVLVVLDDKDTDTWAHGVTSFRNEIGRFADPRFSLTEKGPLRATLRTYTSYGKSTAISDFTIYRDVPDLDVVLTVNWQESRKILKVSYVVDLNEAKAEYEIPYGSMEKPADGTEEAGQQWFAVKGSSGGLAMANDSKYSYDVLGSEMRMTLLRSTFYADHFGEHDEFNEPMDIGLHRIRYRLVPFHGKIPGALLTRKAMELNAPAICIPETFHKGPLPVENSFISVEPGNILVHALKMGEETDCAILRCVESSGAAVRGSFRFPLFSAEWDAEFSPRQVKTFMIHPKGRVEEVNLLEIPL
ncbi:MAG: glycoside hydrolase family 38 C-terminal domain-containing protein [Clostridia bacterium]